jgi:HPt (histidine-containing phosphotransfer) domain-containing protein
VLNPEALAEILALEQPGQPSLLVELVGTFRAASEGYLSRLRQALVMGDHESVLDAAHALRGTTVALGAERVTVIALDLEHRGHQHWLAGSDEQLIMLETACYQVLTALSQEMARAA